VICANREEIKNIYEFQSIDQKYGLGDKLIGARLSAFWGVKRACLIILIFIIKDADGAWRNGFDES
jgi:hypothetical protein